MRRNASGAMALSKGENRHLTAKNSHSMQATSWPVEKPLK
jgi:hypothetical protein